MLAGLFAYGQVQGHRAADLHVVLGPAVRHFGQGIGIHGGLDLGIHLLRSADAGGVDGSIAQGLKHSGGIFQNLCFFLQVGEGVHATVSENEHLAQGGNFIEHTVGG